MVIEFIIIFFIPLEITGFFYDEDTKNKIRNMGWEPPRPAIKEDPATPEGWSAIIDNYSGEDFLFMYREMISNINEILTQIHDPQYLKVEGWEIVPRPGELDYPVPPAWISIRRNVRVGEYAGTPIEDLGITPDIRHNMTSRDLLEENVDLIKKASEILADMPVRQLDAVLSEQAGSLEVELTTIGISRVDMYVDGRPVLSQNVTDGTTKIRIDTPYQRTIA